MSVGHTAQHILVNICGRQKNSWHMILREYDGDRFKWMVRQKVIDKGFIGIHITKRDTDSLRSLFCDACRTGHVELVKYLHTMYKRAEHPRAMCLAASNGCTDIVLFLLTHTTTLWNTDRIKALNCAARKGHIDVVKTLYPKVHENAYCEACVEAIKNGHVDVVRFMCDNGVGDVEKSRLLMVAARYGHAQIVKFLCTIDGVDPATCNSYPIRVAARHGHLQTVRYLCTHSCVDPSAEGDEALCNAAENGHLHVVKFLCSLECVDPSAGDNDAIMGASIRGHHHVCAFLSTLECVRVADVYNMW